MTTDSSTEQPKVVADITGFVGYLGVLAQNISTPRRTPPVSGIFYTLRLEKKCKLLIREGYKVRNFFLEISKPGGEEGCQTQVNFQTIFKVCRMVQFVQKCKENFFDF